MAGTNEYKMERALCLWGLDQFYKMLREGPLYLEDSHLEQLRIARDAFLYGYLYLHRCAQEAGVHAWPARPKLHMFDRIYRHASETRRNPSSSCNFQEEDNVGLMIRIAQKCHGVTLESRALERWVAQFVT